METNYEEQQAIYGIIGKLNEYGAGKEIIQIAKEDMEYGIGQDTVLWYGESGWGTDKIRAFSKIVRGTKDQGFIQFIKDGAFSGQQMEVLLEFHEKGIPLAKLAELMGKEMTPYELRGALSDMYGEMRQVNAQAGGPDFEAIKKQVGDLADNIARNQGLYESVSEQLKEISAAGADAEKIRKELAAEIDQKDRMLGDQQDSLNKAHAQMAALRSERERLEKKVRELEEKEGDAGKYQAEAAKLKETRDGLEAELKEAMEENASVSSELEGVKAERDTKSAELDREKAETARLGSELERMRKELEKAKAGAPKDKETDTGAGYRFEDNMQPTGYGMEKSWQAGTGNRKHAGPPDAYGSITASLSGRTQGMGGKEHGIMENYQTAIRIGGKEAPAIVEHAIPARRDGFWAMLGRKLFGSRKRMGIIKAAAAAKLDKGQMKQVANAICAGLLENEVIDIINSGFDAEEMEQAVEIVLAEKSY